MQLLSLLRSELMVTCSWDVLREGQPVAWQHGTAGIGEEKWL